MRPWSALFVFTASLTGIAHRADAATASVAVPASAIRAWTGDADDSDPRGLVWMSNYFYFFEEEVVGPTDPLNAGRAIIRWDPIGATGTTYLTHGQMQVMTGLGAGASFLADDITEGPGYVIALIRDFLADQERIIRITNVGIGNELVMGSGAEGALAVSWDPGTNRLYVLTLTSLGAANGGLEYVNLGGSLPAAALTQLVNEASLAAVLTTTGTPQWSPSDLTVQSDGDIIIFNGGPNTGGSGDLGCDGDCVRVTSAGAVSLFCDRGLLDASLSDAGTTGYGKTALIANPDDSILMMSFEGDPGGATDANEFLARASADGTTAQIIRRESQILTDLGSGTDLSFSGNGCTFDGLGNLFWTSNSANSPQGILNMSGPLPVELSVFAAE